MNGGGHVVLIPFSSGLRLIRDARDILEGKPS